MKKKLVVKLDPSHGKKKKKSEEEEEEESKGASPSSPRSIAIAISVPVPASSSDGLLISQATSSVSATLVEHTKNWERLENALNCVFSEKGVLESREELYFMVQDLCLRMNQSLELFGKLKMILDHHTMELIDRLNSFIDHGAFLSELATHWIKHSQKITSARTIFLPLDRSVCIYQQQQQQQQHHHHHHQIRNPTNPTTILNTSLAWTTNMNLSNNEQEVMTILELSMSLYRKHLLSKRQLLDKILSSILDIIRKARFGEVDELDYLRILVKMLESSNLYHSELEPIILTATTTFYDLESQQKLADLNISSYLLHVSRRRQQESTLASNYFEPSTRRLIMSIVEKELIGNHIKTILERGLNDILDQNKTEDFGRMYELFGVVNAHEELRKAFASYEHTKFVDIVKDDERKLETIDRLLELRQTANHLVNESLLNDSDFRRALNSAYEMALNVRSKYVAEVVARYLDQLLRSTRVGADIEIEKKIDDALTIFKLNHAKDVFDAFNKKFLTRRLLTGSSSSIEMEKYVISKLKSECGASLTNKLEGMFRDMELSKDLMQKFKDSVKTTVNPTTLSLLDEEKQNLSVDVYVNVLAAGFWPLVEPFPSFIFPKSLEESKLKFENFYSQFKGRCLTWQHHWDYCVVSALLPLGKWDFDATLYQTCVLLLFNDATSLTFNEIQEKVGIPIEDLKRILQSLAMSKPPRLLKKNPKTKEIENTDSFELDLDFKSPRRRVKITPVQGSKESQTKDTEETYVKVSQDRQNEVDAAIVRIMKSRKSLAHNLLLAELFRQLRFDANAQDLKKRIESLMDREYLARDEKDPSVYIYLA